MLVLVCLPIPDGVNAHPLQRNPKWEYHSAKADILKKVKKG